MNEYDSDKMADVLSDAEGMIQTDKPEDADVILFNTCSVRESAGKGVLRPGPHPPAEGSQPQSDHRRRRLRGVAGRRNHRQARALCRRGVRPADAASLAGPDQIAPVQRQLAGGYFLPEIEKFDHIPPAKVDGGAAYVSIMEGCSKYCSFCVVPYTRGEEVSRPFDDVLTEIAGLAAQGVKEITLLGQNVNAYRGAMSDGEIADFALLLEYVHEVPGVERIRFTTSHPREFSQRIIDCYGKLPKLVSHLHLPVQSGADRVLAAMKRGYTGLEYKSIIRKLRALRRICACRRTSSSASPARPRPTSNRR